MCRKRLQDVNRDSGKTLALKNFGKKLYVRLNLQNHTTSVADSYFNGAIRSTFYRLRLFLPLYRQFVEKDGGTSTAIPGQNLSPKNSVKNYMSAKIDRPGQLAITSNFVLDTLRLLFLSKPPYMTHPLHEKSGSA